EDGAYFRFPRASTGSLGKAMLGVSSQAPLYAQCVAATQPVSLEVGAEQFGVSRLILAPLGIAIFGQRGASFIVAGADKPFSAEALALLGECATIIAATDRRIRRFESLSGEAAGLTVLIEQRLGACAGLASAQGEILWMSQSAKRVLGEEGEKLLQARF